MSGGSARIDFFEADQALQVAAVDRVTAPMVRGQMSQQMSELIEWVGDPHGLSEQHAIQVCAGEQPATAQAIATTRKEALVQVQRQGKTRRSQVDFARCSAQKVV